MSFEVCYAPKNPIALYGDVSPVRSQTVYHAVAYATKANTPDAIILVSPKEPYVCVGYHQDLEREVDLDYCRANNLPVYRRDVDGAWYT